MSWFFPHSFGSFSQFFGQFQSILVSFSQDKNSWISYRREGGAKHHPTSLSRPEEFTFQSPAVHWMSMIPSLTCLSCGGNGTYQNPSFTDLFPEHHFFQWILLRCIPFPKLDSYWNPWTLRWAKSPIASVQQTLSQAIPQFHAERIFNEWTPIARFRFTTSHWGKDQSYRNKHSSIWTFSLMTTALLTYRCACEFGGFWSTLSWTYHSFRNHCILNSKTNKSCNCTCKKILEFLTEIISCNCISV